jgi:hypothetical protein
MCLRIISPATNRVGGRDASRFVRASIAVAIVAIGAVAHCVLGAVGIDARLCAAQSGSSGSVRRGGLGEVIGTTGSALGLVWCA